MPNFGGPGVGIGVRYKTGLGVIKMDDTHATRGVRYGIWAVYGVGIGVFCSELAWVSLLSMTPKPVVVYAMGFERCMA